MESCQNCGCGIGDLETPYLWKERVVCATCFQRLQPKGGRAKWMWILVGIGIIALVGIIGVVGVGGVIYWNHKSSAQISAEKTVDHLAKENAELKTKADLMTKALAVRPVAVDKPPAIKPALPQVPPKAVSAKPVSLNDVVRSDGALEKYVGNRMMARVITTGAAMVNNQDALKAPFFGQATKYGDAVGERVGAGGDNGAYFVDVLVGLSESEAKYWRPGKVETLIGSIVKVEIVKKPIGGRDQGDPDKWGQMYIWLDSAR